MTQKSIEQARWLIAAGIRAGIALERADQALGHVGATALSSNHITVLRLREARLEVNRLGKQISEVIRRIEEAGETDD